MQKVNVKLGGINHILAPEGSPLDFLTSSPTMLVGIDVSHPAPKSVAKAPSVVGIVASQDKNFTQWLGTTITQEGRVEMVTRVGELMGERVSQFGKKYGQGPHNIIIYRDGKSIYLP